MLYKLYSDLSDKTDKSERAFEADSSYSLYNDEIVYQRDMSSNEEERMRYSKYNSIDTFKIGSRWGRKISFLNEILKDKDKKDGKNRESILKKIVQMAFGKKNLGNITEYNEEVELKVKIKLGEVGRYFKVFGNENKYINQIGKDGYLDFINMEMLGDYASGDIDQLNQGLEDWLLKEKDIKLDGYLKEHFYAIFDQKIKEFFKQQNDSSKTEITFEEFVNDVSLWATDGSSGKDIKSIDGWKNFKNSFRNTKKIFGLLSNKSTLIEKCLKIKEQRLKVNIKRELVKSRGVVNSDIYTYLLMSYISYICESSLYHSQNSSLFVKSNSDKKIFYNNIIKALEKGDEYFVPIDQSTFDANVNHNMVRRCFNGWREYCSRFYNQKNDLKRIFGIMDTVMTKGKVLAYGKEFDFKNGIPSGWRWTSMFDTAINYAQTKTIEQMMNEMGQPIILNDLILQGDDVNCTVTSERSGKFMVAFFDYIGLTTNRRKMFISNNRTEYLRVQYIKGEKIEMIGLPVRSLPTLFARSPLSTELMSLNSLIDQWMKIGRRFKMMGSKWFLSEMKNDMMSYVNRYSKEKINLKDIDGYLKTDSRFGGYGLVEDSINSTEYVIIKERIITIEREDIEEKKMKMIEIMEKQNKIDRLIEFSRYINNELDFYGEKKIKEITVKREKKYQVRGGNKVLPSLEGSRSVRKVNITEALNTQKNKKLSITLGYKNKNGTDTMYDKQSLFYILNRGKREKIQKSKGMRYVNKFKFEDYFRFHDENINMNDHYIKKLIDSTKSFQNRYLLENEEFVKYSKILELGTSFNNIVLQLEVYEKVKFIIETKRWTTYTLSNVQQTCSQFVVDTKGFYISE